MKRLLLVISTLTLTLSAFKAVTMSPETLHYEARYHCGFLKISAGEADINFSLDGNRYTATLNGQSVPIGHRIYAVSDTLQANMEPSVNGLSKETVTYENGWYTKPHTGPADVAHLDFSNPEKYKNINGDGDLDADSGTMEAITISTDMLAMFYYFKEIDFTSLEDGQTFDLSITLPDGDIQKLSFTYEGQDNFDNKPTYKVSFKYSYHGVMSEYPVTAQVDKELRLPLMLSADIKIGHVELILKS